jgi:hypothetical protein
MPTSSHKILRNLWRTGRNVACSTPIGRRLIFPKQALAEAFSSDSASYSWRLFERHSSRLQQLGFDWRVSRILEVGPGRSIGNGLLWWAACGGEGVSVTLWDTFPNMTPDATWLQNAAGALLEDANRRNEPESRTTRALEKVAAAAVVPTIDYVVCDQRSFAARAEAPYDLILSHSCLEHVWHPEPTLSMLADHTASQGWQSNQIDLMDHGSRETNYLEMLEYSDLAYWMTMRFIPGSLNRWRAQQFIDLYEGMDMVIVAADLHIQDKLPTDRNRLAKRYRKLDERELRTTELHLITRGRRDTG